MRWLVAAIVLFVAAWALQAGLIEYAAAALGLVALANYWLAGEGLRYISAERIVDDGGGEIEVGATVEVKVRVTNEGRRPIIWMLLEDLLPEQALLQRPPRITIKGRRMRVRTLPSGQSAKVEYKATFQQRGVYPVGPMVIESGDLFGFFRRYRVVAPPAFVTVLPKVVGLAGYEIASRRPIGDVRLTHRLYEDPTRIAGVRPYQPGDPLNRIHWRATARTGAFHSKVFDPSALAGATLLVDYHPDGYPARGEPYRSELVATTAASLAHAILELNQQVGLWSNGGDGAAQWADSMIARLKQQARADIDDDDYYLADSIRKEARESKTGAVAELLGVPTRRGIVQLIAIRQLLARLELSSSRPFPQFVTEVAPRLPRDATALAILPAVSDESALALGTLRRAGFAVAVIIVLPSEDTAHTTIGRLIAEGIRDVRVLEHESQLPELCQAQIRPAVVPLLS